MRYRICKLEPHYGLPFYRVQIRHWFWWTWLTDNKGIALEFETKIEAAIHVGHLKAGRETPPKSISEPAPALGSDA